MDLPLVSLGEMPPNNIHLEAAISVLVRSPTPASSKAFYEKLLGSTLVLLEREPENADSIEGDIARKPNAQKRFRLLKGDGGRVALPAFTDPPSVLARYPAGGRLVYMPMSEIARTLQATKHTLVINPTRRQPSGTHVPRAAIDALAKGQVPAV